MIKAINEARATGPTSLYRLMPDAFRMVNSLSPESLPNPISIDISSDMGMVNIRNDGVNRKKSFDISMKLTPLLTMRSMSCMILPIRRTNVRTKRMRKNG
jgi:hypothetical protein